MKVYIITGASHDYDGRETWIQSIHLNKMKGRNVFAELEARANLYNSCSNSHHLRNFNGLEHKAWEEMQKNLLLSLQELDPTAGDLGGGIYYDVAEHDVIE